jgi:hypothetical protein
MTKELGFDYREVDSFLPSRAYRRDLFTCSNLLLIARVEAAVSSKGKWSGLEAAETSMCGAIPLHPHTLLQRDNKSKDNFTLICYLLLRYFLDHFYCGWRWIVKVNVFSVYVIKAQRGRRGIIIIIINIKDWTL